MGLVLSRTETLMASTLDLFHVLLKRLCKHNGQQRQILCDSSSSGPKLKGQDHTKRSNLYPPSAKLPVAESLVATTFNVHSASHRADSPKLVTPSTGEAVTTSARLRAATCRLKYPTELERSALVPFVKVEPGEYKSAPRFDDIVHQGSAQRSRSARTSRRVERAAAKESSFETLTPRLKYLKHIEELEKRRVILQSLKRDYSRARAECERSESTLQCLRRQGQESLQVWRKQKNSAEGSLRKMARKLLNGRALEKEIMMKIDEDEKVLIFRGEELAAWRYNAKDRWREFFAKSE